MLYRFEKQKYLLDMLRTGTMSLSHPSQWPDPYESEFLRAKRIRKHALVHKDGRFYSWLPRLPGSRTAHVSTESPFGRCVFASCFTEVAESERQWHAVRADERVRWSVEPAELLAAFREHVQPGPVSLLRVEYASTEDVNKLHREFTEKYAGRVGKGRKGWDAWCEAVLVPLTVKRDPFRDEHEHRLIVMDKAHDEKGRVVERPRITVSVPMQSLVREVAVDPLTKPERLAEIEAELRKAGFTGSVVRSSLYDCPNFDHVTERPIQTA